jgi:hypothetical protein
MKILELNLEKDLLLIEADKPYLSWRELLYRVGDDKFMDCNLICKGSELTESKCLGLVRDIWNEDGSKYYNDYSYNFYAWVDTALLSFISAVKQKGYYWGENPIEYPKQGSVEALMTTSWDGLNKRFDEAELKTFNPDKTLIFEII